MKIDFPAFPTNLNSTTLLGMTLRDYFAAAAMQGYLSKNDIQNWAEIASDSYSMADAMMEARK
jgi:hypothetical protein